MCVAGGEDAGLSPVAHLISIRDQEGKEELAKETEECLVR